MKRIIHFLAILAVGSLAVFNYSCSSETQSKNISGEDSTASIPVEIASAVRGPIAAYYSTTATLEAEEEAMVVAKVQGIVKDLEVEEGDYIKAGEVMALLEDEQLAIEASRAKATMDRLYNEFQRNKELYDRKLISAEQFENSKFEYESQKAVYDLAQLNVDYAQITAPISGIVSQRLIKVGNMINANQEVFKVTDFNPLLAVLHVPEHEMNKLKKNQKAVLQVDAISNKTFEGRVLRISPVVNPESGTFKVTITIQDASRQLKPGMFGRIRIVYDTRENALMIPKEAVLTEDGINSVYIVNKDLVFRRTIQTGYVNGSNIEIIEGLADGDSVVTIGQSSLQDSTVVQIVSY
ncbi:MAG: efflux RND transporter periplasmic adaptor subunit [Balneolaceae bacterium]|nr:efflux RND transporter periplasmic adaptor subunit [Balneolaceae bacterium]